MDSRKESLMCSHRMIRMNDVVACTKCGLTITKHNGMFIDKELVKYFQEKENKKK